MRIRRLLGNELRHEAYGIAATDRARSRYSWERIGRETLAAYARCVRRPDPADELLSAPPQHAPAASAARVPAGTSA